NVYQYRKMLQCAMPNGGPFECCQTHDNCYGEAEKLKACTSTHSSPYFK
uniref:Phospholipase A2 TI-Nh (Fragments) n=1 Tax=Naja haje haje TaxID=8642 RepID=PA2TI_NAJHH|nr:RecName: Full=Phospholipase A2 TI-Nh; Short=svPLA2; AltName: Full=Phosphatidylcholine 2-acylhydrolase; AltName: Full=Thrombin inhibitor from Naja haje [Naja haje haje]